MNNWLKLPIDTQRELFNQISSATGLPAFAVEKDAWVTLALRMLFNSEIKDHFVFKGGTSLSKCYNLIKRLSEDIDISLDREYLNFSGALTKGQIRKLRRSTHSFVLAKLPNILLEELTKYGIEEIKYEIEVPNIKVSDQDPETLLIKYNSVFDKETYLQPNVRIELGGRSLIEPFEEKEINSLIDESYKESEFAETSFIVKAVLPGKTVLEKMILLHEEFHKPIEKMKSHRMSRHLYDIIQIMKTEHFDKALNNKKLFKDICLHREKFTPLKPIGTIDYNKLKIKKLRIVPPRNIIEDFRKDYREMQTTMFYGESPSFDDVITKLKSIT